MNIKVLHKLAEQLRETLADGANQILITGRKAHNALRENKFETLDLGTDIRSLQGTGRASAVTLQASTRITCKCLSIFPPRKNCRRPAYTLNSIPVLPWQKNRIASESNPVYKPNPSKPLITHYDLSYLRTGKALLYEHYKFSTNTKEQKQKIILKNII
jgi:hypothetical protein